MNELVRTKTGELVANRILGLLFSGELRTGDRIDLDEIAQTLGVSRAPVREGLMHLERDGLVRMPHYRGAFVAAFDAGTVREAFQLYGMLSALTSSRAAVSGDAELRAVLGGLIESLDGCDQVDEFEKQAREFRKVVNLAGSGPHLRALLRSFSGLVPAAAWFSIADAMADERAALHHEYEALLAGDPAAAAAASLDHVLMTAENAIAALRRRGVFAAGDAPPDQAERTRLLGLVDDTVSRTGGSSS